MIQEKLSSRRGSFHEWRAKRRGRDGNLSPPSSCTRMSVRARGGIGRGEEKGGSRFRPSERVSSIYIPGSFRHPVHTLHRAIICIPGANTPPMLRRKGHRGTHFPFETRGAPLVFPPLARKRDGEQGGNNGYRRNNEARAVAPLKTRLMRPSRLNGCSLPSLLFSTLSSLSPFSFMF